MTFDQAAVEALAVEAARTFSDGLLREATQERVRLVEEARRLEELRLNLEEEGRRLDQEKARLSEAGVLEVSDSLPESLSPIRRQTRGEPVSPLDIEADAGAGRGLHLPL